MPRGMRLGGSLCIADLTSLVAGARARITGLKAGYTPQMSRTPLGGHPEQPFGPGRAAAYGSSPARRASTTACSRVCAPNFRIEERR